MHRNRGFSLVELMIVVAIIGILAAIAVPNYVMLQLRAKQAELPANVDGIVSAEIAYDASYDSFMNCAQAPRPDMELDKTAVEFVNSGPVYAGWSEVGWQPDGFVRGNYEVVVAVDNADFLVTATSDLDDDDITSSWVASRLQTPELAPFDNDTF